MQMLMWVAAAAWKLEVGLLCVTTTSYYSTSSSVRTTMKMPKSSSEPNQQRMLKYGARAKEGKHVFVISLRLGSAECSLPCRGWQSVDCCVRWQCVPCQRQRSVAVRLSMECVVIQAQPRTMASPSPVSHHLV